MITTASSNPFFRLFGLFVLVFVLLACDDDGNSMEALSTGDAVFLIIDEESIDNGNEPNDFSDVDVNDQLAEVGVRTPLKYFQDNVGKEIDLYTGEVGDEGWHALKTIPSSWANAGPTNNGLKNYLTPGPGLGGGEDDREVLLDKIPNVTPLRASALSMLKGKTIMALVYDSDVSINYSPLNGNLMGSNLGIVAFDVIDVFKRTDGSTGSLPRVVIRIRNVTEVSARPLVLFTNAPEPESSSEPYDVSPPSSPAAISLSPAN
jgi:hypothetical protein